MFNADYSIGLFMLHDTMERHGLSFKAFVPNGSFWAKEDEDAQPHNSTIAPLDPTTAPLNSATAPPNRTTSIFDVTYVDDEGVILMAETPKGMDRTKMDSS